MTESLARAADRGTIESEILDAVGRFVRALGTLPPRGVVALDDSLDRDLAIGSLERVELLLQLEQGFGVRFPDAVLSEANTPRDLIDAIIAAGPWIPKPLLGTAPPLSAGPAAPASAKTLVDVLRSHAELDPDRVHIFLRTEDGHERPITYGMLWREAGRVGAALHERGVRTGQSVALMLRTEESFFPAFFGVLLAGALPVPIYPPFRADRLEEYARRQTGILANAQATVLVTFREAERVAGLLRARVPSLKAVIGVERLTESAAALPIRDLGADAPALIQYTSGSTGDPKGVLLTHENILANIRALGRALDVRPDDVCVSWLPLYHDMGLIGTWLGALYHAIPTVILSPLAFLPRPARWLWALHAHRGTLSAAPNFAFDLCVKKITNDEIEGLDLSAWRLALNGSEAVSPETIERFRYRFAPYGFRAEAMCPVYGLAESSVGLTVTPPGRGPRVDRVAREPFEHSRRAVPAGSDDTNALRFVSCGRPLPAHDVRIVDVTGRPVPERAEGRIEFRGPSMTAGYFRNVRATRAVLRDGWMDSGDLGYWADGELFVTGRQKDLIIKAGRNLYPQEIETVVGDVPGVRKGCVAAFGVVDAAIGTERLVVVAESRERSPQARERLRAAVLDRVVAALGIPPDTIVIAEPGVVLKTSSGKIRRSATRDVWLSGRLGRRPSAHAQWLRLAAEDAAARLRRVAARVGALAFGSYVGLVLLVTMLILWALVIVLPARAVDPVLRRWCRALLALAGCTLRVKGLEHVPRAAGVIFAANHASYVDAVALLAAIPADFRFVAKRELASAPLVGRIIRRVGHLTVERVDLLRSVADAARVTAVLRRGTSVLFFPEGTFVLEPGLLPFKLGAFKAAVDARCAVVPVSIHGTRQILPAEAWLPRRGDITVTIGAPVMPDDGEWRDIVRLRDRVRAAIARHVESDPIADTVEPTR